MEFISLRNASVSRNLADAKMIFVENFTSPHLLHLMMAHLRSPTHNRLLVAPVGKREYPTFAAQTLVSDVIDEPIDLLQLRSEHLGVAEICIPLIALW